MNTETKKPSEIQALIVRLLPPEEFGEDANVEELYNRVTDMETELSKLKKQNDWKSAITTLPPEKLYILIKTKTGLVRIARLFKYPNGEHSFSYSSTYYKDVIWWKHLPQ